MDSPSVFSHPLAQPNGTAAAMVADTSIASPVSSTKKPAPNNNNNNSDDDDNSDDDAEKSTSAAQTPTSEKENSKKKRTSLSLSKSYVDICHEAIDALKDRTGSSTVALTKWVHTHYPETKTQISEQQFKRNFNNALKAALKSGRFVKVKSSYKISPVWKEQQRAKKKKQKQMAAKKAAAAAAAAKKPPAKLTLEETRKRNAEKLALLKAKMTPEELAKEQEKMERQEAARRKAAELEAKTKERADRLRKRRFPMEDTKLHAEDKELNVKPPADVIPRPYIPYFFTLTRPFSDSCRVGKTPDKILQPSKVDSLDHGSNGLVPDLLQVYHFFSGDVHFIGDDPDSPLVPDFRLKHLIHSVEQILIGHSKTSRMLPPLVTHLFVTCLAILCAPPKEDDDDDGHNVAASTDNNKAERQLKSDLNKFLAPALTPASWADICFLYMDAMERFYTTDTSRDPNVLPCFNTDIKYLLGVSDKPTVAMTPFVGKKGEGEGEEEEEEANKKEATSSLPLPDGYKGYLGDPQGTLYRAHFKLARQDPWLLTAEEIMALLRALTDDILATHPGISLDIAAREEEMQNLLKAKRSADAHFRKIRLAFEGPKKPAAAKKVTEDSTTNGNRNGNSKYDNASKAAVEESEDGKANREEKEEKPFQPTATKKQFESAKRQQQKASDAYEKGIRKLVARTEPVGYDRNFNAVYCFRHDPEHLYVEDMRSPSAVAMHMPLDMQINRRSWHVIETTSLFDHFTSSLDIRGRREYDLYEELMGQGAQQSLRRFLYDDVKERENASNLLKSKQQLQQRLELVRLKCDEEQGRRSGRLAVAAEEELAEVEREAAELERLVEKGIKEEPELDYEELTGLRLLQKFDNRKSVDTRRAREKKAGASVKTVARCTKLISTGNIDGTGLVGSIVAELLELEEQCQRLAPWDTARANRPAWLSKLEGAVFAWNEMSPTVIGPPGAAQARTSIGSSDAASPFIKKVQSVESLESASKRQRISSPSVASPALSGQQSIPSVISVIRQSLLELEERIADMTNLAIVSRDIELADDNMSIDDAETDEADSENREWKKLIHRVGQTMTRKHVMIRDLVISAIAAARKAHLPQVVAKLRAALLQYHSSAAGECKAAALSVLAEYGGYIDDEADSDDEDENEGREEAVEEEQEAIPSVVCAEAAFLASSLDGSVDLSRNDWIEAVKSCKTMSRLASLVAGFTHDAGIKVSKMEVEHHALIQAVSKWEKGDDKRTKTKKQSSYSGLSEVWADVRITDEIIMAKLDDYPWWPAKMCQVKDPELASKLGKLNRSLVTLIGERGDLRLVNDDDIKPFTGSQFDEEEDEEVSKETRSQLDDCIAMARRILRGKATMSR